MSHTKWVPLFFSFTYAPARLTADRGPFFNMDIDSHIELCNRRLSQIWKLVQDLQKDQVPEDYLAFTILEEKAIFWINRLEAVGQVDPGNCLYPEVDDIHWN